MPFITFGYVKDKELSFTMQQVEFRVSDNEMIVKDTTTIPFDVTKSIMKGLWLNFVPMGIAIDVIVKEQVLQAIDAYQGLEFQSIHHPDLSLDDVDKLETTFDSSIKGGFTLIINGVVVVMRYNFLLKTQEEMLSELIGIYRLEHCIAFNLNEPMHELIGSWRFNTSRDFFIKQIDDKTLYSYNFHNHLIMPNRLIKFILKDPKVV
jgi:hypothetical protein